MHVICSGCHTEHRITFEDIHGLEHSVMNCSNCDKRIKIQFCPHCGAFYSITFSNIKNGQYRYKCKKCANSFTIDFPENKDTEKKPEFQPAEKSEAEPETPPSFMQKKAAQAADSGKEEIAFLQNSINTFTTNELFSITAGAFSLKKIIASAAGVIFMLLLLRLFSMTDSLWFSTASAGSKFAGSILNLFPLAILFSFFILSASVVSKITLHRLFHNTEPAGDEIISFALKTAPGVLFGNIILLLAVNSLLILFGKIPLVGPLLFSLAFLPVYIISIAIFLVLFAGLWFYPPIAAHRENGILTNLKNLLMFIKKHNLNLLFMIPAMMLITVVTSAAIYALHTSALALTMSVSGAILNQDLGMILSSIPSGFIKASESAFAGIDSGIFRSLHETILPLNQLGGIISGIVMSVITAGLLSLFISVTATVSSHIYIMMERGISVDDRKKAIVLFILSLLLMIIIQLKKIF